MAPSGLKWNETQRHTASQQVGSYLYEDAFNNIGSLKDINENSTAAVRANSENDNGSSKGRQAYTYKLQVNEIVISYRVFINYI